MPWHQPKKKLKCIGKRYCRLAAYSTRMQKAIEFPPELCNIAKTVANTEQPATMAKYLQEGNFDSLQVRNLARAEGHVEQVIKQRRAQETEMFLLSCALRMNLA